MTRDDIIRMAREAGMFDGWSLNDDMLLRFAALIAAAERKRCIEACEASYYWPSGPEGWLKYAVEAIQARGDK